MLKRLKKSELWLKELCYALLQENGVELSQCFFKVNLRLIDATTVKEPGRTGSEWRVIYSLRLLSLECDFFDLGQVHGKGSGESLKRFLLQPDDYIIGDRGYASVEGIEHIIRHKGYVLVRMNHQQLPLFNKDGQKFHKLQELSKLQEPGQIGSWPVAIKTKEGDFIYGRLCAVRKSNKAIIKSHKRLRRMITKKGWDLRPETLEFSKYVVVFTTFPEAMFQAPVVLELYRLRWQIELAFKRLKSLVQLGHVPKTDKSSCRAWLYGKLFVGLLTEKLIRLGREFSPWRYKFSKIYA